MDHFGEKLKPVAGSLNLTSREDEGIVLHWAYPYTDAQIDIAAHLTPAHVRHLRDQCDAMLSQMGATHAP